MDDLISILIVDDNIEFGNVLGEYLNQCGGMSVKGIARDGIDAINKIKELAPKIVILDLIMPNLDGIGVLERISMMQLKHRPLFIVLTAIGQDIFVQKAIELGAEYYILKPFDINILVTRIRQIFNEKRAASAAKMEADACITGNVSEANRYDMEQVVAGLIKGMGITPNIIGYRYLREVVLQALETPVLHNSTIKQIYLSIADKHNTTSRNIERAIRCAIDSAFKKMPDAKAGGRGTFPGPGGKNRPTNLQVIAFLSDQARLELKSQTEL